MPDLAAALPILQAEESHPALVGLVQDLGRDLDGDHRADYTPAPPASANRNRELAGWLLVSVEAVLVDNDRRIMGIRR